MTRNEAALERAAADPGAVADAALRCEALADALRAWPFVGAGAPDHDGPWTVADASAADLEWADHEARQSGEWRAILIRDLMHLRAMPAAGRAVLRRRGVQYDAATNAAALCDHLAKLARSPEDDSGVSLLAVVVEARWPRTVEPRRPVNRASLARLHRAAASDAAHLPGFKLQPAAAVQSDQGMLPGFEPFTSGVPSWVLSMFDQAGESSSQRGRKGAPWAMRLWVYSLLMVPVAERDGRTVRLPARLGDIERWIWPDGWDRSNRAKHWPAFRDRLIGLGTIRPRIIGPDGRAYMVETVRAPVVPELWNPDAICPIFVSIPRSAAAGAAVDWPALLRYGADSPGMFRAYLATVAVIDYTAREGHGITREIAAPVLRADGTPKRRRGGLIVRDPARPIPNPAARYVGRLTDEDLRRMIGLPNERVYRTRARRFMERLHEDGVIDLERLPDGRVRIFAPGRVVG